MAQLSRASLFLLGQYRGEHSLTPPVLARGMPTQLLANPPMPHAVVMGGGMEKFGRERLRGGEFVWGKVKGHGYWPGRVASPAQVRDASSQIVARSRPISLACLSPAFFSPGSCYFHAPKGFHA